MEIQRTRLSEIVLRRVPRLVVVSAPAGYGKSTFVRQLFARPDNFAVCDCVGVRDQTDLSRAVLVALAEARPALAAAIAQAQLGAAKDSRDWEAAAARFWVEEGPSTFVFENAEALTRSASASVLFERLIRAGDRLIIVCSRDVVPVPYGRGVDPTNVVTFGIDDLRFSDEDIRTALPTAASANGRRSNASRAVGPSSSNSSAGLHARNRSRKSSRVSAPSFTTNCSSISPPSSSGTSARANAISRSSSRPFRMHAMPTSHACARP